MTESGRGCVRTRIDGVYVVHRGCRFVSLERKDEG